MYEKAGLNVSSPAVIKCRLKWKFVISSIANVFAAVCCMPEAQYKYCHPAYTRAGVKYGVWRFHTYKWHYLGRHSTIDACMKALRKGFPDEAHKFTKSKMRRGQQSAPVLANSRACIKRCDPRKFKYITRDVSRSGKVFWRPSIPAYGSKRCVTQLEAVSIVAAKRQCTIASLKLAVAQLPVLQIATLQMHFSDFMSIYTGRHPPDIVHIDMMARSRWCYQAFWKYPGMIFIWFLAGYERTRDHVLAAAEEIHRLRQREASVSALRDEDILYMILVRAAEKINKNQGPRGSRHIKLNTDQNKYYGMNFHQYLEALGILSQWSPRVGTRSLSFQTKTKYYIWPLDNEIRAKLKRQMQFGTACMRISHSVPETGSQYVKAWHDIDRDSSPLLDTPDEKKYVSEVKRGFLRWLMQVVKKSLKPQQLTVGEFCQCFSGEDTKLMSLMTDTSKTLSQNAKRLVRDALQKLAYKDDVELLASHARQFDCINCQTVIRQKPDDWLSRNKKTIANRLLASFNENGVWEHPGSLLMRCGDLP